MLPKISLFDELRKGGYEASLITTFNAYLPFYEEVVLRRLVNAGVRHNVLMMDARQYAQSVTSNPPRFAGRQYTLMPVKVSGAFHPKLIFLAGKEKGLIVIGSHNMTLAGFGFNRELTNLVRIQGNEDAEGVSIARVLWAEVDHWLSNFGVGIPQHIVSMVNRVKDFAPWLKSDSGAALDIRLLTGRPGGRALWDQLTDLLEGEAEARQVAITGAYFDRELRFLKQVVEDLSPDQFRIAIDPKTVQIPVSAQETFGASMIRAESLGADDEKEQETSRYLHAKGIYIEQEDDSAVFASGSANPSAPAWLSAEVLSNVELMLAYRGKRARAVAKELGFTRINKMPSLNNADWQAIAQNGGHDLEHQLPDYRTGLAVVEENFVVIDNALLRQVSEPAFVLCASDGTEIDRSDEVRSAGDSSEIVFEAQVLATANMLHVLGEGKLAIKLLLHHASVIEEHARSGTQRQFKEALLSLDTDTPNIELLIQCIDKIVFSDHKNKAIGSPRNRTARAESEERKQGAADTLAIDLSEVQRAKRKKRFSHSGDFAYLLETLIYHLRIQEDKSIEGLDRFGRSEEEQIGADDDSDFGEESSIDQRSQELLDICHSRISTVISRMVAQLNAYSKGERSLNDVLFRLLAVLAVLREFRKCDGRVWWVEKGKTTVPLLQRWRLLEEIMLTLFEGQSSLLNTDALGKEFEGSDEVARLKGLVLWLAWDARLTMNLQMQSTEGDDDQNGRLRQNAMVLALAQMIRHDDVVIDEARQSIGSLTSSELSWLKNVERIVQQCESVRRRECILQSAMRSKPGDIAVHKTAVDRQLRIVSNHGDDKVRMVKLSRQNDRLIFRSEHWDVAKPQ